MATVANGRLYSPLTGLDGPDQPELPSSGVHVSHVDRFGDFPTSLSDRDDTVSTKYTDISDEHDMIIL